MGDCETPTGELTLQKWLPFLREFQLKRNRVEERTSQEEYTLLMKSLLQHWQEEVLKEEAKRGQGRRLVRMTNLPTLPAKVLQGLIERVTGRTLARVELTLQGAIVHCMDVESQQLVMSMVGMTLEGKPIRCSRMDSSLTGDQLAEFITSRLETEQKLSLLRETWSTEVQSRDVQVVKGEKKKSGQAQSKGRRKKGKGK